MTLRNIAFAVASVSLVAAPVAAQAAQAAPVDRAAAPSKESNELFGGGQLWVFAAVVAILLAWYVIDNNHNKNSISS